MPTKLLKRVRLLAMACALGAAGGCAVNDRGWIVGSARYYANDQGTGRAVWVRTWGIHVITNAADGGVTFGHSDRKYFYPGPKSNGAGSSHCIDMARLKEVPASTGREWALGAPLAFLSRGEGVMLLANGTSLGAAVGVQQRAVVWILARSDTELFLRIVPGAPDQAVISVRNYPKEHGK